MGHDDKSSEPLTNLVDDYKHKIKRVCCCAFWRVFIGVILVITGIALLVVFATCWNIPKDQCDVHKQNLAYTGLTFLLLSFIVLAVGIIFCIAIRVMYVRLTRQDFGKSLFRAPCHNFGEAPYPQQPNEAPCYNGPGYTPKTLHVQAPPVEPGPKDTVPAPSPSAPVIDGDSSAHYGTFNP